jgi:hypothetical protein
VLPLTTIIQSLLSKNAFNDDKSANPVITSTLNGCSKVVSCRLKYTNAIGSAGNSVTQQQAITPVRNIMHMRSVVLTNNC